MKSDFLIVISAASSDPMYQQVVDQVRDAVARGDLETGDRLPSIRRMADELKISPITIKRAYAELETGGYIITRSGLGCFVNDLDRDRLKSEKLAEIKRDLHRIIVSAEKFGISVSDIKKLIK